jgi:hypothetical protein
VKPPKRFHTVRMSKHTDGVRILMAALSRKNEA